MLWHNTAGDLGCSLGFTPLPSVSVWASRDCVYTDHAQVKSMLNSRYPSGKLAPESVAELMLTLHTNLHGCVNSNVLSRSPLKDPILIQEGPEVQVAAVHTVVPDHLTVKPA